MATVALGVMVGIAVQPCAVAADCVGDCSGDSEVTIDELIMMVNIALEGPGFTVAECDTGDQNGDGAITVDEITTAVDYALQNPGFPCTVGPTPTPGTAACLRSGCSGEVCAEWSIITLCVWEPWYACYQTALCEHQPNGLCGWTPTESLLQCLANPPR